MTMTMTHAAAPPRTIRLVRPPRPDSPGILRIATGPRGTYYVFREIGSAIGGRGFAVHRLGLANLYHVRIEPPVASTCECLGFLRHGRCKHIAGLSALIGHGLV